MRTSVHKIGAFAPIAWMRRVRYAQRMRSELGAMTDRELSDIGLHRCHIEAVAQGTYSR